MLRRLAAISAVVLVLGAAPAALAAKAPANWDGLTRVPSKRFDYVYVQPGADFRGYRRVMLDPTEVAFRKDWVQEYNGTVRGLDDRIETKDAARILGNVQKGFEDIFRKAHVDAGYEVVTEPAPDVLRVRTAIINLWASAPIEPTGRGRTFSREAGAATLVVEVRDSVSGALLGRAVDGRLAGDMPWMRTEMSNRLDFQTLFRDWSRSSLEGLATLRNWSGGASAAR
jgi:hypothetical protein